MPVALAELCLSPEHSPFYEFNHGKMHGIDYVPYMEILNVPWADKMQKTSIRQDIMRITVPVLVLVCFLFTIPKRVKILRIFSFVLLFIVLRDAMTPVGLWKITSSLELRFIAQPLTLWLLAISSIGLVIQSQLAIGHWPSRNLEQETTSRIGDCWVTWRCSCRPLTFFIWYLDCTRTFSQAGRPDFTHCNWRSRFLG